MKRVVIGFRMHSSKLRAIKAIFLLHVSALLLCFLAQATRAQEAIRVETNQVLVPVRVIDAERNRSLFANPAKLNQAVAANDAQLAEHILEETVVQGQYLRPPLLK
jgi:hypothetical protein